jgi:hypothetical protein
MHLDSGLSVYALDLATGKVLQQTRLKAGPSPKGELAGAMLPDILVSDGKAIYMREMRFDAANIASHTVTRTGGVLRSSDGGLLDDTWINNAFWKYGNAQAQMLAFDGEEAFGIKGPQKLISKSCGQDVFTAGKGYDLQAFRIGKKGPDDGKKRRRGTKGGAASKWRQRIKVRAQAMVLADTCLFLAGAPDIVDKDDPWAAFEGRKGGVLEVRSRKDGTKLATYKLGAPPVHDGMAAAADSLFIALKDGSLIRMGGGGR